MALDRANNLTTISSMAVSYDFIIIDGAAKLENMLAAAIRISDLVLIPVQPSPYDVWATGDLVDVIGARRELTDGSPGAAFVITRKIRGIKLGGDVRTALGEYDLPVLAAEIVQRQVYPRTAPSGLTVFDENDSRAQAEIAALASEVIAMLASGEQGDGDMTLTPRRPRRDGQLPRSPAPCGLSIWVNE